MHDSPIGAGYQSVCLHARRYTIVQSEFFLNTKIGTHIVSTYFITGNMITWYIVILIQVTFRCPKQF